MTNLQLVESGHWSFSYRRWVSPVDCPVAEDVSLGMLKLVGIFGLLASGFVAALVLFAAEGILTPCRNDLFPVGGRTGLGDAKSGLRPNFLPNSAKNRTLLHKQALKFGQINKFGRIY